MLFRVVSHRRPPSLALSSNGVPSYWASSLSLFWGALAHDKTSNGHTPAHTFVQKDLRHKGTCIHRGCLLNQLFSQDNPIKVSVFLAKALAIQKVKEEVLAEVVVGRLLKAQAASVVEVLAKNIGTLRKKVLKGCVSLQLTNLFITGATLHLEANPR